MMHIKNLNSKMTHLITSALEDRLVKRLSFLKDKLWKIPFYLVDEQTMDCLYPPQKRIALDEECVKAIFSRERKENKRILELLRDCWRESDKYMDMVAVGLYLCDRYSAQPCLNGVEDFKLSGRGGAIFLCPERVDNWSQRLAQEIGGKTRGYQQIFDIMFQKVAIHELAHAFMDGGQDKWDEYLNNPCYRIIEESLANAVSYTHFNTVESVTVSKAISEQPLEYRGYVHWLDNRLLRHYDDYFWRHERDIVLNPINHKGAIKILASWWKRNYWGTEEMMHIAQSVVETII